MKLLVFVKGQESLFDSIEINKPVLFAMRIDRQYINQTANCNWSKFDNFIALLSLFVF